MSKSAKTDVDVSLEKKLSDKIKKTKVTLISYSMKMVIPTGNYANIQPEIIVSAGTIEQAHDFIAPHMNRLWKEYYLIGERKVDSKPTPPPASAPVATTIVNPAPTAPASPVASVALAKATQAVQSCMSLEALAIISTQIEKSVKLEKMDKLNVLALVVKKREELNAKLIPPAK